MKIQGQLVAGVGSEYCFESADCRRELPGEARQFGVDDGEARVLLALRVVVEQQQRRQGGREVVDSCRGLPQGLRVVGQAGGQRSGPVLVPRNRRAARIEK